MESVASEEMSAKRSLATVRLPLSAPHFRLTVPFARI